MALRLSTGARDALLGRKAEAINLIAANTISFNSGGGFDGRDQILDSGNNLAGFIVSGKITISGSATPSNNKTLDILSVSDGIIEVSSGSLTTVSAGDNIILAGASGGSVSDIFRNGVIDVFSGSQPISADEAEIGSKLVRITLSSENFTPGISTNGLNFDTTNAGVLSKPLDAIWSGKGLANGTAGWFRMYDNTATTGVSTTAVRLDGTVATGGGQFNMSITTISTGATTTIDSVKLTMPTS